MKLFRSDEDRQRECTTDGEPEPRPTEEAIAALYRERQFERAESLINIGDLERAIVARDLAKYIGEPDGVTVGNIPK